ncbi:MAG: hydrogenase expression/formation protein HypE [Candidatus Cloacimonetes bacterium]|jgi:hydrogenase expression/formation protein HypE|nr:hydrogenase expression/formation protein HypE [Candidatus Cloacimonadota bacterium]MBT6993944.1 hydrogenase expression/formation protein HypE [Candidatus Cloacimonadota bacterium]MBT7469588.1 hydrogenase expression/formation protein HypE [Candidatus Cloacimonadota bacterium]
MLDFKNGKINLSHGSGGRNMAKLIDELFLKSFDNELLNQRNDQALFTATSGKMVMSTDGHVVSPIFFPGGDIGSLSVHGTVNDVAVAGAKPLYLSAGFIIEEGYPLADLKKIVESMAAASRKAGVPIVTGDTKIVEKGKGDGVFITTTGIGVLLRDDLQISGNNAKVGDKILINGFIGDHGISILSKRENLGFESTIKSDSAALHKLIEKMVEAVPEINVMRDPTRGGVAATLNEICQLSNVGAILEEANLPIRIEVLAACELLGLDPLHSANEGKVITICPAEKAEILLTAMRSHPLGKDAKIIGEIIEDDDNHVQIRTEYGGTRLLPWPAEEQLPRIC